MSVSAPCRILENWQTPVVFNKCVLDQPEQVQIWVHDSLAVHHHCRAWKKAELAQIWVAEYPTLNNTHSPKSTKNFWPICGEMIAGDFVDFPVYKKVKSVFELYYYERMWTSVKLWAHRLVGHRAPWWRSCDITDRDSDNIWCTCRHPCCSPPRSRSNRSLVTAHQPKRTKQDLTKQIKDIR